MASLPNFTTHVAPSWRRYIRVLAPMNFAGTYALEYEARACVEPRFKNCFKAYRSLSNSVTFGLVCIPNGLASGEPLTTTDCIHNK